MKYKVALQQSEEGYSVSVPGLPGCWSQGASEEKRSRTYRRPSRNTVPRVTNSSRMPRFVK